MPDELISHTGEDGNKKLQCKKMYIHQPVWVWLRCSALFQCCASDQAGSSYASLPPPPFPAAADAVRACSFQSGAASVATKREAAVSVPSGCE